MSISRNDNLSIYQPLSYSLSRNNKIWSE